MSFLRHLRSRRSFRLSPLDPIGRIGSRVRAGRLQRVQGQQLPSFGSFGLRILLTAPESRRYERRRFAAVAGARDGGAAGPSALRNVMRYRALAADYDDTLAIDGVAAAPVLAALARVRESGRKLVLVTGRRLPELLELVRDIELFDRAVAENGALLYDPATRDERLLSAPPPLDFIDALRQRAPVSAGKVIVATVRPYEAVVLEAIRARGLALHLIFNKESVMVLPAG